MKKHITLSGDDLRLCEAAIDAAQFAYAPYSDFFVGAAVMTEDGNVYTGCNIENASYPAGICAERVAVSKAVSEGETELAVIAIAGGKFGDIGEVCPPCGICRQALSEFCAPEKLRVLLAGSSDGELFADEYTLAELLPLYFSKESME